MLSFSERAFKGHTTHQSQHQVVFVTETEFLACVSRRELLVEPQYTI